MIAEHREQIDHVLLVLERLARGQGKRRGRPPALANGRGDNMQLYWRENCLHVQPSDSREQTLLATLAERDGIRSTSPVFSEPTTAHPLEVELEVAADRWTARVPSLPEIEYFSLVSSGDARQGAIIMALRAIAARLEESAETPREVEAWFKPWY
jgi:hypothetical protein